MCSLARHSHAFKHFTAAIVLFVLALVISEVLFWVVAVVLGVSMVESRKQIFSWLRLKLGLKA